MRVNVDGVLFSAQAAGRQMRRFEKPGSIIMIGSMSGSIANKVRLSPTKSFILVLMNLNRTNIGSRITLASRLSFRWHARWHASSVSTKSASTLSALAISIRSACAYVERRTKLISFRMTKAFLQPQPELEKDWISQNPLGRLGSPDELRGVALWLASDASTFCTGSE